MTTAVLSAGCASISTPTSRAFAPPSEEDAETRARLAALGYLGSTVGSDSGDLADPKSQLATVEELKVAFEAYAQGSYERLQRPFRQ